MKKHFNKKMSFSLVICILLSVAMLAFMQGCAKSGSASNEFRVGMECGYAPFNWTQTDNSNGAVEIERSGTFAGGYDVEIAKRIAEGLGLKLVIVKTDWEGLLPAITSGKIDAIVAGMSPTDERKETIDFSDNYYESDLVIVVRKDGPYVYAKSLADLSGAKITGQLNTFHYGVIEQIPNVDQQTAMEDFPTMIAAVTSGKIDGYVSERPGAKSAELSNPNLTYVSFDSANGFQCSPDDTAIAIGLKKDSQYTAKINEILKGISAADQEAIMDAAFNNQPASE